MNLNKKKLVLFLLLFSCFSVNTVLFAGSLAEKKEANRKNPENNWLSKILGAGAAVGATKVASDRNTVDKLDITKLSPAERLIYLNKLKQYQELVGRINLGYGTISNIQKGTDGIWGNSFSFKYNLNNDLSLGFQNMIEKYLDDSYRNINRYLFEYNLPGALRGSNISQIGAFVGLKSILTGGGASVEEQTSNEFQYGLNYNNYLLDSSTSLHAKYSATVVKIENFTIDSVFELYGRFYFPYFNIDLGGTMDVTDLENITYLAYLRAGLRF